MTKLWLLTGVLCALFLLTNAGAAEVTLEDCLQRAIEGSSGLKASTMVKEAASHNREYSRVSFYPQVKMSANYSLVDQPGRMIIEKDELAPGFPSQNIDLADDRHDSYQAGLRLTQPLYTGGNLSHAYARAGYQLSAAKSTLQYQQKLLVQQVKEAFFSGLAAGIQVEAASKTLGAREALRTVTRELLAEGYATHEDLLMAEAAQADAEAGLVQAQNQAEFAKSTLRHLIGAQRNDPLLLKGELAKLRIDGPLAEISGEDENGRPDIQAKALQVRQSAEEIEMAKSRLYPNLTMEGGYLRQRETNVVEPDVWSVMLNAEWTIFDWGRTEAGVKRATALNQRDVYQLEQMKKDAMIETEELWRASRNELSHLLSDEARVKSAELALTRAASRRQEGKARQADILNLEALLWQEYGRYYQRAARLNAVIASLERAAVRPIDQYIIRSPLYILDTGSISLNIAALADVHRLESTLKSMPEGSSSVKTAGQQQSLKPSHPSCRLQFGAFSHKGNADRLIKSLITQYPTDLKISIITEDGLFKVVSSVFANKDEALDVVKQLGIKTFIIKAEGAYSEFDYHQNSATKK